MFLAEISHKQLYGWNRRILTEADARLFCRESSLYIVDDPKEQDGRIVFYKGKVFILINPNLLGPMWLWVLWHEIAHFILHAPQSSKFSPMITRKADREANYVAAVAMMPQVMIIGKSLAQVQEELGYPTDLIKIRYEIFETEFV